MLSASNDLLSSFLHALNYGVRISGTMTFGEGNTYKESCAQLDMALEAGVNFIDTAEM